MAFNWQTFRTRSLSALVFVAVMAVGLLWNEWSFLVLFSAVHFGCWWEYYRLVKKIYSPPAPHGPALFFYFAALGWALVLLLAGNNLAVASLSLASIGRSIGGTMLLLIVLSRIFFRQDWDGKRAGYFVVGLLYISLPLGLLVRLRTGFHFPQASYGLSVPLLVIFTNWINDTMAYIVGSLIGKTPFSPISPKKTWEGTIGGALLAVATISLIAHLTGLLPVGHAAALSALGAASGTYGDLAESKLKRTAGVKDSGTMMPGHGGFLDRFDSLLFSATVCTLYAALLMQ